MNHRRIIEAVAAGAADWMDHAACKGRNPAEFHPSSDEGGVAVRAIRVCRGCSVAEPCLEHALALGPAAQGIWAATTLEERSRIRAQRAVARRAAS